MKAECERCGEVATCGLLCGDCAAKELRQVLAEMLGSASPSPVHHPTMTWAWERGAKVLDRTGGQVKP